MTDALAIHDLSVAYRSEGRDKTVLRGVTFRVGAGEAYGLVGESGCGKSTVALTAVRYLPRQGRVLAGHVAVNGEDVFALPSDRLRTLRANAVSMVYQDPGKALNPTLPIGRQMAEIFTLGGANREEARARSLLMLDKVRISDPQGVMARYPHQLSGGMQQRVAIAMALAKEPELLILDEPTTGLDATVEAEVLDLVSALRRETGTSILFISHNLGIIARMCDRVGVLYAGMLVEEGPTAQIFRQPRHPYTAALLRCLPAHGQRKDLHRLSTIPGTLPAPGATIKGCAFADRCPLAQDVCRTDPPPLYELGEGRLSRCHFHERAAELPHEADAAPPMPARPADLPPVLRVENLNKTFDGGLRAVKDVSLEVAPGETLGLVGESGSGKTTFARLLLGLLPPDPGGTVTLDAQTLPALLDARSETQVKALQIVFQNPDSALNRAHSIRGIVGRAMKKLGGLSGAARETRLRELLAAVRLPERYLSAKPRQLSGGLKQRVAIARAFAGEPRLVVCDEPTSALDVSVQAAILNLLADLQRERDVSYIFISHDLGVVRYLSDKIAVLYLGRIMEFGAAGDVFEAPHHPYTEALLSSAPAMEGEKRARIRLEGEIPSAARPPSGCVFHTRCPRKIGPVCEEREPPMLDAGNGHALRCHIPISELARLQGPRRTIPETAAP
ncbi:MAG: ABC transporter ATP-binding protein [Mesorhizobium amorphae]|nr:MAG: ABC transporter ATP-binding protein [Mesorhizobium amorphae]